MNIEKVCGSEIEMGVQLGKLFESSIREFEAKGKKMLEDKAIAKDYMTLIPRLEKHYPAYLEHLYARAEGAGVDKDAYTLFVCAEVYEGRGEHCTDIMAKISDDEFIMGHNEDGDYTPDNIKLVRYEKDDGFWFYDYTGMDSLPGCSFTFNKYGLFYTMNYLSMGSTPIDRTGIPVWFVLREAVNAKDAYEFIDILKDRECASGFNVNMADYASGRVYTIESRRGKIDVIEVTESYAHSNHYIHPCFNEHLTPTDSNTLFRLVKSQEMLNRRRGKITAEDVKETLLHKGNTYYNSILGTPEPGREEITACTVIYSTKSRIVTLHNHMLGTTLEIENKTEF